MQQYSNPLLLVRQLMCCLFFFFILFPFVRILPIGGYTQPYALIIALVFLPWTFALFLANEKKVEHIVLFLSLLIFGVGGFIFTCYPYDNIQEYKYLSAYLSFPSIALLSIFFLRKNYLLVLKLVEISVLIWFIIASVQKLLDPSFMLTYIGISSQTAIDIVSSGRGVLSLAPEPTHYAYHMLMLAAILVLLEGNRYLILLCIFQAVILAKSSSALLALMLGYFWVLIVLRKFTYQYILMSIAMFFMFFIIVIYVNDSSRIITLLKLAIDDPLGIITADYSLNLRFGGMVTTLNDIFENAFVPRGLSHEQWLLSSDQIKINNPWLFDISKVGPPSGIVMLLFQMGGFIIPCLCLIIVTLSSTDIKNYKAVIVSSSFFVVLGQYYISAPPFSVVYAAAVFRILYIKKDKFKEYKHE